MDGGDDRAPARIATDFREQLRPPRPSDGRTSVRRGLSLARRTGPAAGRRARKDGRVAACGQLIGPSPAARRCRGFGRTSSWFSVAANALGAFHAGAYEALYGLGLRPNCVAGSSIGAITAALIAGNPEERQVAQLRAFWNLASHPFPAAQASIPPGAARSCSRQCSRGYSGVRASSSPAMAAPLRGGADRHSRSLRDAGTRREP